MKRLLAIISAIVLFTGCANTHPTTQQDLVYVNTPVLVYCNQIKPSPPAFYFDKMSVDNTLSEKVAALLADRELYKAYILELETTLNYCIGK